jgi:hypothetical protein
MQTVEEYHQAAIAALTNAERSQDVVDKQIFVAGAAVYAELAKTADYAEEEPIGPVASVTALRPEDGSFDEPVAPEVTHHFITTDALRQIAAWGDSDSDDEYRHGGLIFERRRQFGKGLYMSWPR